MKALYVYNEHDMSELKVLERVIEEMGSYITLVNAGAIRDYFPICSTPALIILREDMQGTHMLGEGTDGKLRITGELYKAMEEEEYNWHKVETHRIDNLINKEVTSKSDDLVLDIMMRGGTV
ncbi:hypothetical protein AABM34_06670 [Lysinibacillus fusiformis]